MTFASALGVVGDNIQNVTVDGFEFWPVSGGGNGVSDYGMQLRSPGPNVVISNVTINPGPGSGGSAGTDGANASLAADGANGAGQSPGAAGAGSATAPVTLARFVITVSSGGGGGPGGAAGVSANGGGGGFGGTTGFGAGNGGAGGEAGKADAPVLVAEEEAALRSVFSKWVPFTRPWFRCGRSITPHRLRALPRCREGIRALPGFLPLLCEFRSAAPRGWSARTCALGKQIYDGASFTKVPPCVGRRPNFQRSLRCSLFSHAEKGQPSRQYSALSVRQTPTGFPNLSAA